MAQETAAELLGMSVRSFQRWGRSEAERERVSSIGGAAHRCGGRLRRQSRR
jgi:hypothetical protein